MTQKQTFALATAIIVAMVHNTCAPVRAFFESPADIEEAKRFAHAAELFVHAEERDEGIFELFVAPEDWVDDYYTSGGVWDYE